MSTSRTFCDERKHAIDERSHWWQQRSGLDSECDEARYQLRRRDAGSKQVREASERVRVVLQARSLCGHAARRGPVIEQRS